MVGAGAGGRRAVPVGRDDTRPDKDQGQLNMTLAEWVLAWRRFWSPIPIPDGEYVRWQLQPVKFTIKDGKIIEKENQESYGGTD